MEYRMLKTEEIGGLRTDRIAAMEALTRSLNDAGVRKTDLFLNIAESLKQSRDRSFLLPADQRISLPPSVDTVFPRIMSRAAAV